MHYIHPHRHIGKWIDTRTHSERGRDREGGGRETVKEKTWNFFSKKLFKSIVTKAWSFKNL